MGIVLSGSDIRLTLARAHQAARTQVNSFAQEPLVNHWERFVSELRTPHVPKTYLAVFAVTLVARAMHSKDVLSVWDIKTGTSEKAYSASSIGHALATFAKTHDLDLRARSSQPLNNQPFTFKSRILQDPHAMTVAARHHDAWRAFTRAVSHVETTTPSDASDGLAVLFRMVQRASSDESRRQMRLHAKNLQSLVALEDDIRTFVQNYPDGGRTGQAFAASVLQLVYGEDNVQLGLINDPDFARVGDVHVASEGDTWLWGEVKQRVITAGDVLSFASQVASEGGSRAVYCAFVNSSYPDHVSRTRISRTAETKGVALDYFDSPGVFMSHFFGVAPGSTDTRVSRLLVALEARLIEAECAQETLDAFYGVLDVHGVEPSSDGEHPE
jgi:hypothetical protein